MPERFKHTSFNDKNENEFDSEKKNIQNLQCFSIFFFVFLVSERLKKIIQQEQILKIKLRGESELCVTCDTIKIAWQPKNRMKS